MRDHSLVEDILSKYKDISSEKGLKAVDIFKSRESAKKEPAAPPVAAPTPAVKPEAPIVNPQSVQDTVENINNKIALV